MLSVFMLARTHYHTLSGRLGRSEPQAVLTDRSPTTETATVFRQLAASTAGADFCATLSSRGCFCDVSIRGAMRGAGVWADPSSGVVTPWRVLVAPKPCCCRSPTVSLLFPYGCLIGSDSSLSCICRA